jgi:hypothetical protein
MCVAIAAEMRRGIYWCLLYFTADLFIAIIHGPEFNQSIPPQT